MIATEFNEIIGRMYGAYGMLADQESQRVWYEQLKEFDFADIRTAVDDYTRYNSRRPTIADIIEGTRRVRRTRQAQANIHQERLVRCPYCNDTGLVTKITPTGIRVGHPCESCPRGRENYPWYFMSDDERETALKEAEKRGEKPPRKPHQASHEFYMQYCYGVTE